MNPIKIVTASAGSGKTYRLATELFEAVSSGEARPEAVLATTFTVKAASELKQRVRSRLLAEGLCAEAERLGAARFGTVNSVCERLVSEYAFELGLPPDMSVLDEDAADQTMKKVISSVLTAEEDEMAGRLDMAFGEWKWQEIVGDLIALARANGIQPDALPGFAERSRKGCLALLGEPADDDGRLERAFIEAADRFLEVHPTLGDGTSTTRGVVDKLKGRIRSLRNGQPIPWSEWATTVSSSVGVRSREAYAEVQRAAEAHDRHPALRRDLSEAIGLVFELAQRSMKEYQAYKQTHGMIDFPDQEMYALELLSRPDVQNRLSKELDLVMVDEFQDTSPIQLAIFLKLAGIAKRSVWVGDQKQAIFGFRGTDPALVEAAIEKVCEKTEPETLPKSWRSRPDLVKLTSAVFAPAFSAVGIPPGRVILEPAVEEPAGGLGEIVEHWSLDSKNRDNDCLALAEAACQLLADGVHVRDRVTSRVRDLRPGDIAVLCRTNDTCTKVTRALEARGIRVCIPRPGLLATLEGRLALAGLRLWADTEDNLAEAELAYLKEYPADGDAWLTQVVKAAGDHAFAESPTVKAILDAKKAFPGASPVEALDCVFEATAAVETCHRWGNTPARLANLEKFRALAVGYQTLRSSEGSAATVVGLVQNLLALSDADKPADDQGEASGPDAVTVSTWHGAKGLEWPVTILFELEKGERPNVALGLHAETDIEVLSLEDPLAGRWIRYWPNPYGKASKNIPFLDRLAQSSEEALAARRDRHEQMRLLYVGWTRARDRLILAARKDKLTSGILSLLKNDKCEVVTEPKTDKVTWAGKAVRLKQRAVSPVESPAPPSQPEPMLPEGTPREHPPAVVYPSKLEAVGAKTGEPVVLGDPLTVRGTPAWDRLGNAVHGFFAADRLKYGVDLRTAIANRLLEGWDVAGAIPAASLLEMGERLWKWIEAVWPGARVSRELPLTMKTDRGSVMTGTADLVLDMGDRLVLIDHKSFPGSREAAAKEAAGYAGQLDAYRRMLEAATGRKVEACFIHCPVSGIAIPLIAD